MKKVIALLVFLVFIVGCSKDDPSSRMVSGKWSTDSFYMYVYSEQTNKYNYSTNKYILQPVITYSSDRKFTYNTTSVYDCPVFIKFEPGGMTNTLLVGSNYDKRMSILDWQNAKTSSRYFDFSTDKEIHFTEKDLLGETVYRYR